MFCKSADGVAADTDDGDCDAAVADVFERLLAIIDFDVVDDVTGCLSFSRALFTTKYRKIG